MTGIYYAHLPWVLGFGLCVSMTWGLWQIIRSPRPHPSLQTLALQRNKWILCFQDKQEVYDTIQIGADSGFFLLVHFSSKQPRASRWLVIFYDQVTELELRTLNIVEMVGGGARPNS